MAVVDDFHEMEALSTKVQKHFLEMFLEAPNYKELLDKAVNSDLDDFLQYCFTGKRADINDIQVACVNLFACPKIEYMDVAMYGYYHGYKVKVGTITMKKLDSNTKKVVEVLQDCLDPLTEITWEDPNVDAAPVEKKAEVKKDSF